MSHDKITARNILRRAGHRHARAAYRMRRRAARKEASPLDPSRETALRDLVLAQLSVPAVMTGVAFLAYRSAAGNKA